MMRNEHARAAAALADEALFRDAQRYLTLRLEHGDRDPRLRQRWEEFFAPYNALLHGLAASCRVAPQDQADIVQDVWTCVITKLSEVRWDPARSGVRAWLYSLVHRRAVDAVRWRKRHSSRQPDVAREPRGRARGDEASPASLFEQVAERERVHAVLGQLREQIPDENYRLMYARWIEERPAGEVAEELGLTREEVYAREHRLRVRFRVQYHQSVVSGERC